MNISFNFETKKPTIKPEFELEYFKNDNCFYVAWMWFWASVEWRNFGNTKGD